MLIDLKDSRGYVHMMDPDDIAGISLVDEEVLVSTRTSGSYILVYKDKEFASRVHGVLRTYIEGNQW